MTGNTNQGPSALKTTIWMMRYAPGAIMRAAADDINQRVKQFPKVHWVMRTVLATQRDLARLI